MRNCTDVRCRSRRISSRLKDKMRRHECCEDSARWRIKTWGRIAMNRQHEPQFHWRYGSEQSTAALEKQLSHLYEARSRNKRRLSWLDTNHTSPRWVIGTPFMTARFQSCWKHQEEMRTAPSNDILCCACKRPQFSHWMRKKTQNSLSAHLLVVHM